MKKRQRVPLRDRARAWAASQHDWLRPGRPGVRLAHEPADIAAELGGWPRVYAGQDGAFHIVAPHLEPHIGTGLAVAVSILSALGFGAYWLWENVHPLAGGAAGVAVLALLPWLVLRLAERHLEIIVEVDGHITRRTMDGRRFLILKNYRVKHEVIAGPHGAAKREATQRQLAAQNREVMRSLQGRGTKSHPMPPLPSIPVTAARYAHATEVTIMSGPNTATPHRVAEFRADTDKALRLKAAIEYVISLSKEERARRTVATTPYT